MPGPDEFEIIDRYFTRPAADPRVLTGIGDDAAIVAADGPLAIAVDMLVAGTHFDSDLPAHAVGHRALAVNLSDLAAMGARPRWATLALSLPEADPSWIEAFAAGFFALAESSGVELIGGDTTRGPLTITVQVIGDAAATPLLRSGGCIGDRVLVSGTLGDSAAALDCQRGTRRNEGGGDHGGRPAAAEDLIARFSYPAPRIALGQALAGIAHAAIDVSDGLLADLGHICRQSGCGATLDLAALPLSPALTALYPRERAEGFALSGGDDYELCFTCAAGDVDRIEAIAAQTKTAVTPIGMLTAEQGIRGEREGTTVALEPAGFTHF